MATDLTYEQAVELFKLTNGSGEFERFESAWNSWGAEVGTDEIVEVLKAQGWKDIGSAKVKVAENSAGRINGYVGEFYGNYPSVADSNVTINGSFRAPINTTAQVIEEKNVISAKVGLRETGSFVKNKVAPAVVAAGIGITLGKTIDSTLYDLSPNFWDSHGMSSLDPSTWSTITSEDDSLGAGLFDLIFQIDDDGNIQTYLDETSLAYLADWLSTTGAFDTSSNPEADYDPETLSYPLTNSGWNNPLHIAPTSFMIHEYRRGVHDYYSNYTATGTGPIYAVPVQRRTGDFEYGPAGDIVYFSKQPFTVTRTKTGSQTGTVTFQPIHQTQSRYVPDCYYYRVSGGGFGPDILTEDRYITVLLSPDYLNFPSSNPYGGSNQDITIIMDGATIVMPSPVEGIGTQDGATTPNTTGWTSVPNTLQSLQQQYPTLWDNAKHQDYVDEDGTNKSITLIPINLPNVRNPYDLQPTSGDRSQDEPLIDPTTATKDLIDTITKLISGTPPINPPTTGGGGSPTVVAPVGTASSLWAIYNPTQAQVNAFGAWLWDSSFVEQIKKLFNDPMQAIIGIHKVFATPSIGGTATIKVGYLDSQVSSAYVDDQYTTVNCGTVNLTEYFGNVFDYSPYTRVSLYLPFIGIVDLDVADVMRSSINVTYHVDVLSGACLADVTVTRDLGSAVLYQYSGSAIVTYPVSSGNYMGMVAGVLSVASGIAGTVLSGGALAPALIGGAVGASHLHTDVSHSGSFSGCAGAMGGKKPYLIISRPQTAMADNYGHFTGKPANSHVTLKNCGGMTRVKSVYVGHINATDEEKDMIENQLKAGVLV